MTTARNALRALVAATTPAALVLRAQRPGSTPRLRIPTRRHVRPAPRPAAPNAALLRAHVLADRLWLDVERALADELAPLLAEHAAPDEPAPPSPVVRLDAPGRFPEGPRGPLWHRPARRRPSIAEPFDRAIERARGAVSRILEPTRIRPAFERIAVDVSAHVLREMRRAWQHSLGVDPITSDAGLAGARERFVRENVARITRLSERRLEEIRDAVSTAVARGTRVEVLAREIEERGGVSRRRASLIARDQVLTANAEITRLRMQNAGVVEYEWDSSRDERVRPIHRELHGTVQRWDNPPVISEDGETGHPGDAINCRCVARPRLEGLL